MRLSDIRSRRDHTPLPAEVDAELRALDAALAGDDVPARMQGLEALVGDLRAARPAPDADFGAALDRWAAAGFPRGRRPGIPERATRSDAGGRARLFLQSLTPRRPAYAGGAAAALVVVAVGVAQIEFGDEDPGGRSGGGGIATLEAPEETAPIRPAPTQVGPVPDAGGGEATLDLAGPAAGTAAPAPTPAGPGRGRDARKVERDAQLTLAAAADEVQDVTNDAIDVVERNRGIVLSSQTTGTEASARATLQLAIPTTELDATLDQLSDLADVRSLSEGSLDITRPYVDAKDRLDGLQAERRSVLTQIELADTQDELDSLKLRLAAVERQIAGARSEFQNIRRRATLSQVTVQITSDGVTADEDDGDWSFGDALDDAGRVLTVAAGVALITAAVLLPIALIAAIGYFVLSGARRRARDRALDG